MSESVGYALAVDAGQSSITLRADIDGEITQLSRPGVLTDRELEPQLASAVNSFINETGLLITAAGIGSSGLDSPNAEALLPLLDESVTRVALAHDSTTGYLGALGDQPGVMIACGTGVVTLALGEREVARVDGWGYILGDAGSAYWIGRNALEAAMRGYDGRRTMTRLTDVVAADFDNIELAYLEIQGDPNRVARVASYAAAVDRLAPTDPVAANILDKAAAHLSEAVQAGAHRVGLTEAPRVAAIGQVFSSTRLLNQFVKYLALQWPNFALVEPVGAGIDGARRLLELTPESPLHVRVSTATR